MSECHNVLTFFFNPTLQLKYCLENTPEDPLAQILTMAGIQKIFLITCLTNKN
jgi:hypothetical protein